MESFSAEQLDFFKLAAVVLDVFPVILQRVFVSMWDSLVACTPGCPNWDDSTTVRNRFLAKEGGKIDYVPTDKSYLKWDCTALFQATLFSQTFALPDGYGKRRTLYQLYVEPLPIGAFHDHVLSPTGKTAETWALALDQLRLLRNTLCHLSSTQTIDKTTFDHYLMLARDAFTALEQNSVEIDRIQELTEDNFPKIQQLKHGLERENSIVIGFKWVNNHLNAIKSQDGPEVESGKWQCSDLTYMYYLRNVINGIASMKKDEQSDKRKKDLKLLLSCLQGKLKMDFLENSNAERQSVACIICKEWIVGRAVFFILTDKGGNSDCVDAASGSGNRDPDVFLFSPSSDSKKKSPFVVLWKTPSVLEMKELSHVGSTFHESIHMLFLQPQFQQNCVVGQDFYMEVMLATYATSSLCTQINYLPVLVEMELSKSNKDCSNIDSIVNSTSIHVSYFSYIFSNQRHAQFVFDNLICSLGKLLALTEVQHAVISPLHNAAIFFFLEAKFSNSSLSVVVEKDSVIVKCRSMCERESTCICLSVRNTLKSKMESLSHDFRVSVKSFHLQLHCEEAGASLHDCECVDRETPCSGLASETGSAYACACSSDPEYVLEGEQGISLPRNKDETSIKHSDLGDAPVDGPLWCIVEYAGLESEHTKSDLQASVSDEVPLSDSAHCDVSNQLDTSLLSVYSNSSLNSFLTTPSDPAQEAPDFYEHFQENSFTASVDCSSSNLALQENSSQLSFGVDNLQGCSVVKSSYEEGLSSLSGKEFFDAKARKVEPLEDTVEETREEHKCGLQDVHSSSNTESGEMPCTAPQGTPDPSFLTVLPTCSNKEGKVAMLISQLQSDVAFYQHQCDEERQRSSELEEKLKQSEEEKQQLEVEVGRHQFLECKEKRSEKILQSTATLVSEQSTSCTARGGSSAFTGTTEQLLGGAGTLQEPSFALQQILLEISNSLSETELKQMKFLAKPKVNNAFRLAKIREGFELFEELDAVGVLSCTYVRELLRGIQRFDLLEKLDVPLLINAKSDDAFCMEEEPVQEPNGAFCMEDAPEQAPRSSPPTGQMILERTTESSVLPLQDHNQYLLLEKASQLSSGGNLLQLQSSYEEGLATAEGDPLTETRETDPLEDQLRPQLCHPTDGELRDGVDRLHQHNIRKSDSKGKRMFLSAKNDDDVVRLITTAAERDSQERIERLQRELQEYETKNQILQAGLKRTSLPVDKHIGHENIFQLSREHASGVASRVEQDLPGGAVSLPGARSHPPTGQKMFDRITESSVIPPGDRNLDLLHLQDNRRVSRINEAGPVPNMSCGNSVNSGGDMVVLPMNSDSEDSSVHARFPDSSNGVSFSSESSSTTVSSSEISVSSAAEPMRVESTSSSCTAHSVCDGTPRVTSSNLSTVKNHERFSDTCPIRPTSGEEAILESTLSNACEGGDMDRKEDSVAKNEEIGEVADVGDGPGKPRHLTMKIAASEVEDVVDCGPLRSPDRAAVRARSQHMPGFMQDALPDGDISVEQNVSGAFSGAGKDTTVNPLASDVRTQSKQWVRLGARPRDRPPVKMAPPPEPSLIELVPQEIAKPMAGGLVNAFLARHSQDQSLHESLCQGSAVELSSDENSLQGTSYVDGVINSSESNKAKPCFGDCQVVSRPDVDSRWMFPPPETGMEYDSHNAVGGCAYNAQLNGHVGPLSSYLTGGTSNFPSSSAFNSSNYNLFRSDFALGTREPHLPLYGQFDSGLNTSVAGNQRLHSGMTGSHLANGSLMGAAGPQLTPPVHGLQRYGGPSDNASTMASEREQTQSVWNTNSTLPSIANMARVDVGISGLPAPLLASRSSGADDRYVSEAESSRTSQYALGTGGGNVLNTSGDRVVAGANRDIDNTHTAALRSDESRGSRLVGIANGDSNLEPRGADASLPCANTGGSMLNRDFGTDSVDSTDNSLLALEQRVEEACALVERVLREREEREQFGREIERKEREIREQRARKKREREAREQEEASRWPQQQECITGRSQWLCEHYQRHCRVRFPCCTYFYPCHRCHNNSKACDKEDAKASHATHLKCSFCQHEQEIGEDSGKCRSCGAQMSAYFCSICKHFTSVDKNPYHCKKCGICRIHKDKSFHCEVCNVCLDKRLKGKHKCRPDSGHDECCICLEDAFSGCQILPCSHKVHRECAIAMVQNGIRTCPVCRHPLYSPASQ